MRKIVRFFKHSFNYTHQEKGQGLVEYALILGFAALAVLAIVGITEISIEDTFSKIAGNAPVAPPSLFRKISPLEVTNRSTGIRVSDSPPLKLPESVIALTLPSGTPPRMPVAAEAEKYS